MLLFLTELFSNNPLTPFYRLRLIDVKDPALLIILCFYSRDGIEYLPTPFLDFGRLITWTPLVLSPLSQPQGHMVELHFLVLCTWVGPRACFGQGGGKDTNTCYSPEVSLPLTGNKHSY